MGSSHRRRGDARDSPVRPQQAGPLRSPWGGGAMPVLAAAAPLRSIGSHPSDPSSVLRSPKPTRCLGLLLLLLLLPLLLVARRLPASSLARARSFLVVYVAGENQSTTRIVRYRCWFDDTKRSMGTRRWLVTIASRPPLPSPKEEYNSRSPSSGATNPAAAAAGCCRCRWSAAVLLSSCVVRK